MDIIYLHAGRHLDSSDFSIIPVGVYSIACELQQAGHTVTGYNLPFIKSTDQDFDAHRFVQGLEARVFMLGWHWYEQTSSVAELCSLIRASHPKSVILIGGLTASLRGLDAVQSGGLACDCILAGEADYLINRIVEDIVREKSLPKIAFLNKQDRGARTIDSLRFDHLDWISDLDAILKCEVDGISTNSDVRSAWVPLARGCTRSCPFCGGGRHVFQKLFGHGIQYRRAQVVSENIRKLVSKYGINQVRFTHDLASYPQRNDLLSSLHRHKDMGIYNEFWSVPRKENLRQILSAFCPRQSHFVFTALSPFTCERRHWRRHDSNRMLLEAMEEVIVRGGSADLYLSSNLSFRKDQWHVPEKFWREVHRLQQAGALTVVDQPVSLEPESLIEKAPEKFGVELTRKTSFDDLSNYCRKKNRFLDLGFHLNRKAFRSDAIFVMNGEFLARQEGFGGLCFNLRTRRYAAFNRDGFRILQKLIAQEMTSEEIVASWNGEQGTELELEGLKRFIENLLALGLIREAKPGDINTDVYGLSDNLVPFDDLPAHPVAPVEITLNPTYRCNQQCVFCYNQKVKDGVFKELSAQDYRELVREGIRIGACHINILGGEPLLRPDCLKEILQESAERMSVAVSTNGSSWSQCREEMVSLMRKHPSLELHFSFHSHRPEVHDLLTGRPGAFASALESFKHAVSSGIFCVVKSVACNQNVNSLEEQADFWRRHGAQGFILLGAVPGNGVLLNKFYNNGFVCKDFEKAEQFVKHWQDSPSFFVRGRMRPTCQATESLTNDNILEQLRDNCGAGRVNLEIDAGGTGYPCCLVVGDEYMALGTWPGASLMKMWNHPTLQEFRSVRPLKLKPDSCNGCEMTQACGGGCPALANLHNGSLNRTDPLCPRHITRRLETEEMRSG